MKKLLNILLFCLFVTSGHPSIASDHKTVSVDFSRYKVVYSESVPSQYVFTNGTNKPVFGRMSNSLIYVSDLDNDKCDDGLLDFADSAAEPRVFFGNSESSKFFTV